MGGTVMQWVEHWTCDQQVVGSNRHGFVLVRKKHKKEDSNGESK